MKPPAGILAMGRTGRLSTWPNTVLGVLCAVWRTLAGKYKNYLTSEARGLMAVYRQKEGEPEDE